MHGVTHDNPPCGLLFNNFHTTRVPAIALLAPTAPAPMPISDFTIANPMLAMMAGNMAALVTMFQQHSIGPVLVGLPQAEQSKARSEMPNIIYPDIQDYFERVTVDNPRCRDALEGLVQLLVSNDFFCIDDIAGEAAKWFMAEPYNLSAGNAEFVVRIVGAEIDYHRIKRQASGV